MIRSSHIRTRHLSLVECAFCVALLGAAVVGCSGRDDAEELASTGLELAKQQQLAEALEYFDRALSVDPNNLKALYNAGLADLFLRKGALASRRFEAFTRLRPKDALGHFNLARAYALSLHREEALASLRRAVELGFDKHDELMGGGFEAIEDDLRFAQIEVLVAQRAGVEVNARVPGGGSAYGGQQMRSSKLPGQRINVNCVAAKDGKVLAGLDADFASDCQP